MNTSDLITEIDAEIDRFMQVRKLLLTGASFQTRGRKRKLSAAARARISAAQKEEMETAEEGDQGITGWQPPTPI